MLRVADSADRMVAPMAVRWCAGLLIGTLLFWAASPLFVRSYQARVFDPVLKHWCYPEGTSYRWRSEGYATTSIGPHGMAGRTLLAFPARQHVIALWGDSQAEGVSVADDKKLWSALQSTLSDSFAKPAAVLPLGHSGEDAADWVRKFRSAESTLAVESHYLLVCELKDLHSLAEQKNDLPIESLSAHSDSRWLDTTADFVLHAARGLLIDPATERVRRLRFQIGPPEKSSPFATPNAQGQRRAEIMPPPSNLAGIASALAGATEKPLTVIYAPNLPVIMAGQLRVKDDRAIEYQMLAEQLDQVGIPVVDCRDTFRRAAIEGRFAHGFHNGLIGSGHLNAHGYQLIAEEVGRSSVHSHCR